MNKILSGAVLLLATLLSTGAEAHRGWFLPSATVLSGDDVWVTVDAAISNDLFYFEHNPMRLDALTVTGPDGAAVKPENLATGKYRSTFDVHLVTPGTYRIAAVNDGLMASYKLNGENKRWRGTAEALAREVPAGAEELKVTQAQNRLETFVTAGKPTTTALAATGRGLELAPVTHPNDLFAGEEAKFRLLLDGKPAPDLEVKVIPGGIRYRDQLGELTLRTNAAGEFAVRWPEPGMYWINAVTNDNRNVTAPATERRASYAATLEVLAP